MLPKHLIFVGFIRPLEHSFLLYGTETRSFSRHEHLDVCHCVLDSRNPRETGTFKRAKDMFGSFFFARAAVECYRWAFRMACWILRGFSLTEMNFPPHKDGGFQYESPDFQGENPAFSGSNC